MTGVSGPFLVAWEARLRRRLTRRQSAWYQLVHNQPYIRPSLSPANKKSRSVAMAVTLEGVEEDRALTSGGGITEALGNLGTLRHWRELQSDERGP